MTPRELQAEILSGAKAQECAPHVGTNDDARIAEILNAGRTRLTARPIGVGAVMVLFGATRGAEILDLLDGMREAVPAIKWAWHLLEHGELDVGEPATRAQIDMLTGSVFSSAEAAQLKALALEAEAITPAQVGRALRGPWED